MKKSLKVLKWSPRIICILAILFVSMFAADAFAPGLTFWQQLAGFLIHLIPSFILISLLIIAWNFENIGGILFIVLGIAISPFIFMQNYKTNHSVITSAVIILAITFPFILAGVLFLLSHAKTRKKLRQG